MLASMLTQEQLKAYFDRIGVPLWQTYQDDPETFCTKENLRTIVLNHTLCIPFENLDMHNKLQGDNPIAIDLSSVYKKIVTDGTFRGGYCFETTGLLKAALLALGFQARSGIASVTWLKEKPAIRTHEYLIVTIGADELLVDPGFGQPGPIEPLMLKKNGHYFTQPQIFPNREADAFLVEQDSDEPAGFKLFSRLQHTWRPELEFKPIYTSNPMVLCDSAVIQEQNRVVSATQLSPFLSRLIVTQPFVCKEDQYGRYTLSQTELKLYTPEKGSELVQSFTTQEELLRVLEQYFNMSLPQGSDLTAKQVTFAPSIDKLGSLLSTPAVVDGLIAPSTTLRFSPPTLPQSYLPAARSQSSTTLGANMVVRK
ncbi:MAG: arylamine N-acetyltransferase [Candidatus Berkiella sp.]